MKLVKLTTWFLLLLPLAALLLFTTRPTRAQTDPETTPTNGYPPPATPSQTEEAYPDEPSPPAVTPTEGPYIAPTSAAAADANLPPAVIGESAGEATTVSNLPISRSDQMRNRAILWAGFLITLILFSLAVYGAMLMYTRPRS